MPEPGNIIHQDQSLYWNAYAHARRNALSTGANLITQMVVVIIIIIIFNLTSKFVQNRTLHFLRHQVSNSVSLTHLKLFPFHI